MYNFSKFQEFAKKASTGQPEEKLLFHGTNDQKVIECICHQNFDFRMHGKNATMYGKGKFRVIGITM